MTRCKLFLAFLVCTLLLVSAVPAATLSNTDHLDSKTVPPYGMVSTADPTILSGPVSLAAVSTALEPIRLTTAKSLREQDFAPILETSLFTTSDYSAYAWMHFRTGASSVSVRLRCRWFQPDGSYFDTTSPWWSFGSEGMAAAWIMLQGAEPQTGRWTVKYYSQMTVDGSWNYFGENTFFINSELPCTDFLVNGGFESGSSGWVKSANTYVGSEKPHWGSQSARQGAGDGAFYTLYQDVTLPSAAPGELSLAYYQNISTEKSGSYAYDFFDVQIRDTSGNLLETLNTVTNLNYFAANQLDVWQPLTWDLGAYAGSTVRIWAQAQTDGSLPTTMYLDDWSLRRCLSSASFQIQVILAEPSDESHDSKHDRAYYEDLLQSVQSYHTENTLGRVVLNQGQIYDNDGSWYKLSKTHKEYAADPLAFVREAEQAALGTTTIPADTIAIVVHAGDAAQTHPVKHADYIKTATWEKPQSPNGNEIVVSEDDPIGAWAHEIGHDLGSLLVNSVTPDLDRMGNVDRWDLMARGSWNGGWLCGWPGICNGSNPPHMSSYTKEFLQLLTYDRVDLPISGSYWIDVLPRKQWGDTALQYVVSERTDGTPDTYYVVETRSTSSKYSRWDRSVPDSGLSLYWIDTRGKSKYGNFANNIDQTINHVALLEAPGLFRTSEYLDADNLIRFTVVEESAQGNDYSLRLDISSPAPDPIWLAGVILKPAGQVASSVAPWLPIATPSLYLEMQPDLDLHVYTADGRHVGFNYATGEYENQVEGALASGNLGNAHEWILLPEGIDFQYVVRSTATDKFLRDNPDLLAHTDGIDGYAVRGLISNPATGFHHSSEVLDSIGSGTDLEHHVMIDPGADLIEIDNGSTTILPVDLAVVGTAPALATPGDIISYTLAFGNSGGSAAGGVYLVVQLPQHTEFVSAPGFVPMGGGEYLYEKGAMDVADGEYPMVQVRVDPEAPPGTPIDLTATVGDDGSHGPDGVPGNNQVTVRTMIGTRLFLPLVTRNP